MRAGPEGGRRGPEPGERDSRPAVPLRSHSRAPRFGQVGSAPRVPGSRSRSLFSDSLWVPRWEERTGARPSRGFAQDARGKQLSSALGTASALDAWQKLGLRALKPGRGHCQEVRAWPSRLIH
uniref:Uncharacterized protein n=1 Tax=Rangifer tarandus platyrhynchus TaxID=3082113 RepID=A0ACB0EWZ6_RANTA|nr:unnamed protein product [Rangifer tarandus platyrhynchus]